MGNGEYTMELRRRAELERAARERLRAVVDERDRLRARFAWLRRAYGKLWLERASSRAVVEVYQSLWEERSRLRAALEMIAIPPVHVPDLSESCEGSAGVARAALDGTDYSGRVATILANEMARAAVIEAAREYVTARSRWHAEAERIDGSPAVVFRRGYDDTQMALVDAVAALDVSGEGT